MTNAPENLYCSTRTKTTTCGQWANYIAKHLESKEMQQRIKSFTVTRKIVAHSTTNDTQGLRNPIGVVRLSNLAKQFRGYNTVYTKQARNCVCDHSNGYDHEVYRIGNEYDDDVYHIVMKARNKKAPEGTIAASADPRDPFPFELFQDGQIVSFNFSPDVPERLKGMGIRHGANFYVPPTWHSGVGDNATSWALQDEDISRLLPLRAESGRIVTVKDRLKNQHLRNDSLPSIIVNEDGTTTPPIVDLPTDTRAKVELLADELELDFEERDV